MYQRLLALSAIEKGCALARSDMHKSIGATAPGLLFRDGDEQVLCVSSPPRLAAVDADAIMQRIRVECPAAERAMLKPSFDAATLKFLRSSPDPKLRHAAAIVDEALDRKAEASSSTTTLQIRVSEERVQSSRKMVEEALAAAYPDIEVEAQPCP